MLQVNGSGIDRDESRIWRAAEMACRFVRQGGDGEDGTGIAATAYDSWERKGSAMVVGLADIAEPDPTSITTLSIDITP